VPHALVIGRLPGCRVGPVTVRDQSQSSPSARIATVMALPRVIGLAVGSVPELLIGVRLRVNKPPRGSG